MIIISKDINEAKQNTAITFRRQPPVTIRPTFRCLPDFVVGMPVARAIFLFAWVMPTARFHENDTPGILNFFLRAIYYTIFSCILLLKAVIIPITV